MKAEDKIKLLLRYRDKTGVEFGTPNVDFSNKKDTKKVVTCNITLDTSNKIVRTYTPVYNDNLNEYDDLFMPLSFSDKVEKEEKGTVNLYDNIKCMIKNIDCTNGYDNALQQFDSVLLKLSEYSSGDLTTSQIMILISTMIVKLEELSKIDYPEASLQEVLDKIQDDSNKLKKRSDINKYFFASFFKYYANIEKKNIIRMKKNYGGDISDLTSKVSKKSDMLYILLKWLIS